jgi:hypothetical protein
MSNTIHLVHTIKSEKFNARFDSDGIFIECMTDKNNLPCSMSKTKRGILKAWNLLVREVEDGKVLTESQATTFLDSNGIKMHSWCAMD